MRIYLLTKNNKENMQQDNNINNKKSFVYARTQTWSRERCRRKIVMA